MSIDDDRKWVTIRHWDGTESSATEESNPLPVNSTELNDRVGEVSATPTANTLQDRLKNIYEAVDGLELSVDNIDIDMDDVEQLLTDLKTLIGEVQAAPTANTVLDRLKQIKDTLDTLTGGTSNTDILNKLEEIRVELDEFHTNFENRDLATETKQDNLISEFSDEFNRIKMKRFKDNEEVRYGDGTNEGIPSNLLNSDIYVGVAPDGTSVSASSWTVIRTRFGSNKTPTREQIRFNVQWDDRTNAGW